MDEKREQLTKLLRERMLGLSDGQIDQIIKEARDEALAEAKTIIKEAMVQVALARALDELEGVGRASASVGEEDSDVAERSAQPPEGLSSPSSDALETSYAQKDVERGEQLRQEIEAIRSQIAENEQQLRETRSLDREAEPAQEPTAEEAPDASSEEVNEGHGYYVYGIVRGDSSQAIDGLPEKGIAPTYPVYAIPYQKIQAIVSKVPLQEFGQQELEANLEDMEWVKGKVRAHQSILEEVLTDHTLLPMRFCTIYRREDEVQETLAHRYDDFADALTWLEGKQEWGVKLYCDEEILSQEVAEVSDRVREFKAEIEQESSGAAYFKRKEMEDIIEEEVECLTDDYAQRSHDCLTSYAEEAVINALQDRRLTGREETMVLNGAYLVTEKRLADFRGALESLEEEYGDLGFQYELTGPWPPYSFVGTSSVPVIEDEEDADE